MEEKQIIVINASTINTFAKIIFWVFLHYMLSGELPIGKIKFPLFIVAIYMVGKFSDFIESLIKKKCEFKIGSVFKERR